MSGMLNVPDTVPTGSATGNPRNKVALKKGRGLMDWVRLGHTEHDLAGTGGKMMKVTPEELAKHNKREDAWMALKGYVYNVTPYFEYHPGGEDELIRGAGIDATDLFNEVHKWVNFQSILQKCLIGTLVESRSFFSKPNFLPLKRVGKSVDNKKESACTLSPPQIGTSLSAPNLRSFKSPGPKTSFSSPQTPLRLPAPSYDWFQTKTLINVAIYTKWKDIRKCHVIVINNEEYFKALVYINDQVFTLHLKLFKQVESKFDLKIGGVSGKVDILLRKSEEDVRWSSLGKSLPNHNDVTLLKNKEIEFYKLKILDKNKVTHNSFLIVLEVPEYIHFGIPFGFHVYLKDPESTVVKPYTPVMTPFLVKAFSDDLRNIHIYFKVYPDGKLTPLLGKMTVGDELDVSFPEGSFTMENLHHATANASQLVLLGAGTGITPHIRLMLEGLKNEKKTIMVTFNRTEEDIPWKIELDSLVVTQSKLFRVYHVLSNPSSNWKGYEGYISKDLLEELLPDLEDGDRPFICICGPKGFTQHGLSLLEDLEYDKDYTFGFTG